MPTSDANSTPREEMTSELVANLVFSAKIATAISIFCLVAAMHSTYATIRDFRDLNVIFGQWTPLHFLTAARALLIPASIVFSVISWRCSTLLKNLSSLARPVQANELSGLVAGYTWLWIGISLFAAATMLEVAARYSMMHFGYL